MSFVCAMVAAAVVSSGPVAAQDQATQPAPATVPTEAAPTPPTTSPSTAATPATPPPPPPATADPATTTGQQQLPEVEVIQAEPKPDVVLPDAAAPRAARKPPVQVAPRAVAARPRPAVQQPSPPNEQIEAAPVVDADPQPPAPLITTTAGPPSSDTSVRVSPLSGSEIPLAKVPTNVGTASAAQIGKEGSGQVQQTLQQTVPGIVISDIGGSGFRTDVSYRGFDASPIGGRAQGLAVYQNGVRINESFGDAVNLDLIPTNAIQDITVISANPVFGLNAIGGAISIVTKDGFTYEGGEIDAMFGSFGRKQVGVQAGGNSGGFSAYVAAQAIEEDGFRDFSEAEVRRFFGDVGYKNSTTEIHFNLTAADSLAGVVTAAPVQLLREDYGNTFTNPQDTEVKVLMPTLTAKFKATETLTFSGVGYYRQLRQRVVDGNLSEADACTLAPAILCLDEEPLETETGAQVPVPGDAIGSIERINTDADSYGLVLQAVDKSQLFSRPNQFLVGVSYDHGDVSYKTSSEVGTVGPKFVVTGTGAVVVEPDDLAPRDLETENDYYGIYFSNTLDVTDALSVTVGGRYNHATITLEDLTGEFPELNTTNKYGRFNPTAGATYRVMPGLSVYGNYAEANRAPTAAELGCAEPENPCFIESFLTDDPPLKQVVSKGFELGVRGEETSWDRQQRFTWSLGAFRTRNIDDILSVAATATGRGFFLNAGDTQRQGFEAAVGFQNQRVSMYASYALLDATFKDDLVLPAPNTPGADPCPDTDPADEVGCNFVDAGDHLPGIPRHRFKAGIEYWMTPQWKVGADLVTASDQFFFGDEANNNDTLSGYTRVDLNTSYDLTENVQIYGLVKNLFDRRYGLYGTFFSPEDANEVSAGSGVTFDEDEVRSITPSLPFAAYGGVKIKF